MPLVPSVVEKSPRGERSFDVFSRLLNERIVMLNGQIEPGMASIAVASMLHLSAEDSDKQINLYISSEGGSVLAGFSIIDTMHLVPNPISVTCFGIAMSMGALILSAGDKGKRYALPNSRIMIHQISSGFQGQASDIAIHAEEALYMREKTDRMLADNCGRDYDEVRLSTERDNFMSPEEALEFGLIDQIVTNIKKK